METYIVYPTKEQEKVVIDFFKSLDIPFEKKEETILPKHVLEGIKKGQEDIKAGRIVSLEEFKKNLSVSE
ncbi:hypothetical protein [Mucilaginibacter arboris]|uniref:Uncharacterized protein n=1 Tax=Mucilaginibacter arboris TaxID=2682090 RepID=A0A7K1SWF3_9SPHI|nr:hypothetical protein [Mucilaginibacter arboris]MVN21623.1 hypothetical protein [Mucilaginibacter arboris]